MREGGGVHEGHYSRTSLPIIVLVEFEELTSGVGRENAVVHIQSRLQGDECGVMLDTGESAWLDVTRGRKRKEEREEGEDRQTDRQTLARGVGWLWTAHSQLST